MDIILALTFISRQFQTGVFDSEVYYTRVLETLEEAAQSKDADEQMKALAKFITEKP